MMNRMVFLILSLLTLTGCEGDDIGARVVHVIDGDTVIVRVSAGQGKVRIAYIDSAELTASCPAEEKRAQEARDYLRLLLKPATPVTLSPKIPFWWQRDKYGRLLATIALTDGRDVGSIMRQSGHARWWLPFTRKPNWCGGGS